MALVVFITTGAIVYISLSLELFFSTRKNFFFLLLILESAVLKSETYFLHRWNSFQKCVEENVGHCSNTWNIFILWNENREKPYFNETQRTCGSNIAQPSRKFLVAFLFLTLLVSYLQ